MAFHSFVAGERPTAAQWNDWVGRRALADCTSGTRPSSPVEGEPIYETDTDAVVVYDGSAWVQMGRFGAWTTYTPTWTCSGTAPAIGNGTLAGRYRLIWGRTYLVHVEMLAGSTTTFGTGNWSFATPSGLTGAAIYPIGHGLATLAANWAVTAQGSGATMIPYTATSSGDCRLTPVTVTSPTAWANTHLLTFTMILETTA